jgi:class 3 adenylate cyclase
VKQQQSPAFSWFYFFFPTWKLNSTPWADEWLAQDFVLLKNWNLVGLVASIILCPYHYFFVDTPLGLIADKKWFYYRFGLFILAVVLLGIFRSLSRKRDWLLRSLMGSYGAIVCYMQSQSMTWYSGVPYFWSILLTVVFAVFLRLSIIPTILYCLILFVFQYQFFEGAGVHPSITIGAFATGIFIAGILRSNMSSEIDLLIEVQKNLSTQIKLIETEKEMSTQIEAFLPAEIRQRFRRNVEDGKMNVMQAMDEVLCRREAEITVLFSDLRGYTLNSKNKRFLSESALPNMKNAVGIVEKNNGIPRQWGDLIFAYFDRPEVNRNYTNATRSAFEIARWNELHNSQLEPSLRVKRFVLMDVGKAYVGNIGGVSSAREITAMGTCVNRVSRIDALTKVDSLSSQLGNSSIVMSGDAGHIVSSMYPNLKIKQISLASLGIEIKDFSEEKYIWISNYDLYNWECIFAPDPKRKSNPPQGFAS